MVVMKQIFLLFFLLKLSFLLHAMEAPQQQKQRLGQAVPSLKETIVDQVAKNINSLKEFNDQTAKTKIPQDLYCQVIRSIIKGLDSKTTKFTSVDLIQLIDQYCTDKFALKAYVNWKMMRQDLSGTREALKQIEADAQKINDTLGYNVAWSISEAEFDSPLTEALRHDRLDAAEFFISMGVKPTAQDLINAISADNINRVQLIINSGAPIENQEGTINQQPLLWAITRGNEQIIALLINAGASITKLYLLTKTIPGGKKMSVAEQQRRLIQPWLEQPANERIVPQGQTMEELEAKYRKILSLIDKYEKLEQSKSKK